MTEKELTKGELTVGADFNPSELIKVDIAKRKCAEIIDLLFNLRDENDDGEVKRLCSIAITELEGACMWAVKAIVKGSQKE